MAVETASVGRIVHYVSYGTPGGEFSQECRAAIVTEVDHSTGSVGLCVLNPTGQFFHPIARNGGCPYDGSDQPQGGSWHWPERV